jgi:hypothetical protein
MYLVHSYSSNLDECTSLVAVCRMKLRFESGNPREAMVLYVDVLARLATAFCVQKLYFRRMMSSQLPCIYNVR